MNKSSNKNSSSKYIGVHFDKTNRTWKSTIKVNNLDIHLGSFKDEIEAAKNT